MDRYHLWVPIEETDLLKSVAVDENGDYIVQGVMTSDTKDEENDSIDPHGMDCSYFLEKGWIKYEHGHKPEQYIGEPLDIRVGTFTHPTTNEQVNGIFVKGRLFAQRELARQAVKTIQDLQKSNTKRRMGWSIEGQAIERDKKTNKIKKSILRNVVLTMSPVNTTTWAELAKSFTNDHAVVVSCDEPVNKAMDTESTAELAKQSLEGCKKDKDKDKDKVKQWLKDLLKKLIVTKSLYKDSDYIKLFAFYTASAAGFDHAQSQELADSIENHVKLIKSFTQLGGEQMSDLAKYLDIELEEFKKSLELSEDLLKSDNVEPDDDDDYEEDDDQEEQESEKGQEKSKLTKSLSEDHSSAFEVSDFLQSLTDEIGFSLEALEKSMSKVEKQNSTLSKALVAMMEATKGLVEKVDALQSENEELKKSLDSVLNRPVGRRSVITHQDVTTVSRSSGQPTNVFNELLKAFEAGEISGSEIARFEVGVPLERLNLPQSLREKLGV